MLKNKIKSIQTKAPEDLAKDFILADDGTTAIEYGLVAGGISVAIITVVWSLGGVVLSELYEKVANAILAA